MIQVSTISHINHIPLNGSGMVSVNVISNMRWWMAFGSSWALQTGQVIRLTTY